MSCSKASKGVGVKDFSSIPRKDPKNNTRQSSLVSSMGRADLLWPRVDLDLTRKVRSNTGRVNVDQRWARLEAGRGGDSFDPL